VFRAIFEFFETAVPEQNQELLPFIPADDIGLPDRFL
jgi:hypothetical protein